jgi:phosphoesterase RecJ-like protein
MMNLNELKNIILGNHSFLLTTHVNPDADAIGSEIALYQILKKLGKQVYIVNHSATPYNLIFLDADQKIEQYNQEKHSRLFKEIDVLVALDFNRSDRMVSMREIFTQSKSLKICIDHHQEPESFADHYFVDIIYSSTGHIIYDLIKQTGIVELSYDTAYPIYAAIMTDTGSFRFERTTPGLHIIISELLNYNVSPGEVFDKIYDQSLFSKVKLLGKALDSLQLYGESKQISYMIITREMLKSTAAIESDTDGFVNFALAVQYVKIGLLFIELNSGFKVSFRSKGNIPVHKLAAEFGGGGHSNAAGARLHNSNIYDHLFVILKKTEEYLELYKENNVPT